MNRMVEAAGPLVDRHEHVRRITAAWQKTVANIVETGRLLIGAKDDIGYGGFEEMIRSGELPFKRGTAYALIAIAENRTLSDVQHVEQLPASWGTLYQLAMLPKRGLDLGALIAEGAVHPQMERKDVRALLPAPPKRKRKRGKPLDLPVNEHDRDFDFLWSAWEAACPSARTQFLERVRPAAAVAIPNAGRCRWVRDDGGRKRAGYGAPKKDCVARAVAIATGKSYREVREALVAATHLYAKTHRNRVAKWITGGRGGRGFNPDKGCYEEVYGPYLKSVGWQYTSTKDRKVRLRADELPSGRLIVCVHQHLVAVIDGVIHDTYDSGGAGRRPVKGYYTEGQS
jgi:hypothetical protein